MFAKTLVNSFRQIIIAAIAKSSRGFLLYSGICVCSLTFTHATHADGFNVTSAETILNDNVYYLSARLDYSFSGDVLDALRNGVPMVLAVDIQLVQPRKYIPWPKEIAELAQRYQLQYQALTEQYIVKNLNSGALDTYSTLTRALYQLGIVEKLPVIDANLLEKQIDYTVRVRTRLEFDSLPVPLRLSAIVSRSWWLSSEWYAMKLQ